MVKKMGPSELEKRFQQPEGWRWHNFERNGRKIRFGSVFPKDKTPDAIVVCLQGVREFSEKYFETANWCLSQNLAFWTLDWAGQGLSTRYLSDPQKRHSMGFKQDIEDLHYFIDEYIKHSSVSTDKGRIAMALLGHSMGANIGLRYLYHYPDTFECAAFTAPMTGIKVFRFIPQRLALIAAYFCNLIAGQKYIPGGNNWDKRTEKARLTKDPLRHQIEEIWCKKNPDLRCGDVTLGWVYNAQKSCLDLQKKHRDILTPCLVAIAGHEDLVDNRISHKIMSGMADVQTIDYPGSYHEILMEQDDIRDNFLGHFYNLIKEKIIDRPETLKPF